MSRVSLAVAHERDQKAWLLRTQRFMTVYEIAAELGVDVSTVSRGLKRYGDRMAKETAATIEAQKAEQTEQANMIARAAMQGWERSQEDAVEQSMREKSVAAQPDTGKGKRRDGGRPGELFDGGEDDDSFDPEDVPGGCYMDEDGNDLPPEETARRIADYAFQRAKQPPAGSGAGGGPSVVESIKGEKRKGQVGDARFLQVALAALETKRKIWGLDAPKPSEKAQPMVVKVYLGEDVRDMVRGTAMPVAPVAPAAIEAASDAEFSESMEDSESEY